MLKYSGIPSQNNALTSILIGLKSILSHVLRAQNTSKPTFLINNANGMCVCVCMCEGELFCHWTFPTIWTINLARVHFGDKIKQIIWCCTDYTQQMSARAFLYGV